MRPELSVCTASSIQEAIDSSVQAFDYPEQLSMKYTSIDGRKVTRVVIEGEGSSEEFEVRFQGDEPNEKPVLKRITDEQ